MNPLGRLGKPRGRRLGQVALALVSCIGRNNDNSRFDNIGLLLNCVGLTNWKLFCAVRRAAG